MLTANVRRRCLLWAGALFLMTAPAACQDLTQGDWDPEIHVRSRHLETRRNLLFGDYAATRASLTVELPNGGAALLPEVVSDAPGIELMPTLPFSALETEIRGVNHARLDNQAITLHLDDSVDFFFQPTAGSAAGMESATGLRFPVSRQFALGVAFTLTEGIDPYRTRLSEASGFFGFLDLKF